MSDGGDRVARAQLQFIAWVMMIVSACQWLLVTCSSTLLSFALFDSQPKYDLVDFDYEHGR